MKRDKYDELLLDSKFYRIYESLWQSNILELNEFENLDEYKLITFDILNLDIINLDEKIIAIKLEQIFKFWVGNKFSFDSKNFKDLAISIKNKIKK